MDGSVYRRSGRKSDFEGDTAIVTAALFGVFRAQRLRCGDAARPQVCGLHAGTPEQWANETHGYAPTVWNTRPADNVLDDRYLRDVMPILDRQLGVAGLRLAKFLNDAAAGTCTAH